MLQLPVWYVSEREREREIESEAFIHCSCAAQLLFVGTHILPAQYASSVRWHLGMSSEARHLVAAMDAPCKHELQDSLAGSGCSTSQPLLHLLVHQGGNLDAPKLKAARSAGASSELAAGWK